MLAEIEQPLAQIGAKDYCFAMRNTLQDARLKDKFEGAGIENVENAVQETFDWLDQNPLAEKEEFEAKQKELEGVVNAVPLGWMYGCAIHLVPASWMDAIPPAPHGVSPVGLTFYIDATPGNRDSTNSAFQGDVTLFMVHCIKKIAVGCNKMNCNTAEYKKARYEVVANEMRSMLVKVGWKNDMVEEQIPNIPISGKMGDDLLKCEDDQGVNDMYGWTGIDIVVGNERIHFDTIYDTIYDFINKVCKVLERPCNAAIKSNQITITNEKGRLSQSEKIRKRLQDDEAQPEQEDSLDEDSTDDAAKYREEDEANKSKIEGVRTHSWETVLAGLWRDLGDSAIQDALD
jgi:molecular chaperone DnaK (HSP70)